MTQTWDDAVDPDVTIEEATPEQAEPEQATELTHIVESGDSYSAIAKKYYGSASPEVYNALAAYNEDSADSIGLGDEIKLPPTLNDGAITRVDLVEQTPAAAPETMSPNQ